MDIKQALYLYLSSKALLTGLIGSPLRLYPDAAPQGVSRPYVDYVEEDSKRAVNLTGASAYCDTLFTFKVHADLSEDRDAVKEALRNILHGRFGLRQTDGTVTIDIRSITLDKSPNSYQSPPDGSETGIFECELDFRVIFLETVPTLP